jgi:hypothetical protein
MPIFRAIIERAVVSRYTVEVTARNLREAAKSCGMFAADRAKARGVTIVRPHADDPNSTQDDRVVEIRER